MGNSDSKGDNTVHYGSIDTFHIGKRLGRGAFGNVYHAIDERDLTKEYAIKILREGLPQSVFDQEVEALKKIESHSSIITLHEVLSGAEYTNRKGNKRTVSALVFELADFGELFQVIAKTGEFSEQLARHYFRALIEAIDTIHHSGYIHRDLKLDNLLLTKDYSLKIADFGLCARIDDHPRTSIEVDEVRVHCLRAPELYTKNAECSGPAIDVFAAGIILFEMCFGVSPFENVISDPQFLLLKQGNLQQFWTNVAELSPDVPAGRSPDLQKLISGMLAEDPEIRLSIEAIKQHPWFNKDLLDSSEVCGLMVEKCAIFKGKREKCASSRRKLIEYITRVGPNTSSVHSD